MSTGFLKSPLKKTPSSWEDDKRMTALYSPFKHRETNPVDYDSKLKFWHNNIIQWCLEKNTCVFSIKKIQEDFKRKERVPLGLNTVIENLERDKLIQLKEDFMNIDPNESWTDWAVKSLVKTPVIWSFTKLKLALVTIDESTVDYICIDYLKKKSDELLIKICDSTKIFGISDIKPMLRTSDDIEISQESFEILLKWMQLNNLLQLRKIENDTLIKFGSRKDGLISEGEVSLFVIEKNKLSFEKAIEALEEEKDELILQAKSYLQKGMRDTAKSYLRRKKEIEKTIAKRVSALENIEILLSRIYETSTDSIVLDTYRIALNAMKSSFQKHGLSEEEATKTITEIQEINEMHEEIQNALAEPVSNAIDTELEDELMEILKAEKQKDELNLPEVPSESPEKLKIESKKILEAAPL